MSEERSASEPAITTPPLSTFLDSGQSLSLAQWLGPPRKADCQGRLEHFDLLRLIGAGGMGLVFLAREIPPGTEGAPVGKASASAPEKPRSDKLETVLNLVAIKLLKPELAHEPRAVAYFLKEIRHLQQLTHPNIIRVLHISENPARPYFVMPYFSCGGLAAQIHPDHPFDVPRTLGIARQVASALSHAHKKGIIHRDLKPANILLDEADNAILTDFGLAHTVFNDSLLDLKRSGQEGTVAYMSPTVASGEAEDTRSDIYSFGALLYEMLTGFPPYQGKTSQAILTQILKGPPQPLLERNPRAHSGLVRIAEGAMARPLRERYADMADVLADLEHVAKGKPPLRPRAESGRAERRIGSLWERTLTIKWAVAFMMMALVTLVFVQWRAAPRSGAEGSALNAGSPLKVVRQFPLPGTWSRSAVVLGEWNGDGEPELFMLQENKLLVLSKQGQVLWQGAVAGPNAEALRLNLLWDIDGDRRDEAFVSWREKTQLIISVVNQNYHEVKRFQVAGSASASRPGGEEYYDNKITARKVLDLDGDGRRELLAIVYTGLEQKPRGIYHFDFETGTLRWRYETGPIVTGLEVLDLDGDGSMEFVFGTGAVANGNRSENGTDDHHSHVGALRHDGKLLWLREQAGYYSYAQVLVTDLDGDGVKDLCAMLSASPEFRKARGDPEIGQVLRLNHQGDEVARYDAGAFLQSWGTADLDGDGKVEVVATDRLGFVHVLNSDLSLRQRANVTPKKYDQVMLSVQAFHDLDKDGRKEIVLTSRQRKTHIGDNPGRDDKPTNVHFEYDNAVLILNSALAPVARHLIAQEWIHQPPLAVYVTRFSPLAKPELLILSDKAVVLEWESHR